MAKKKPTPFDIQSYDLGDPTVAIDRLGVDQSFSTAGLDSVHICLVCNYNTPAYRLIPRHEHLNTAQIQDKGFVCEHCLSLGHISPDQYALRKL